MGLCNFVPKFYRVKDGQTLAMVADAFSVPMTLLARENELRGEPFAGQVLSIPQHCGNVYRVKGGETRTLLCGSPENFLARNGTSALYPTQKVFL